MRYQMLDILMKLRVKDQNITRYDIKGRRKENLNLLNYVVILSYSELYLHHLLYAKPVRNVLAWREFDAFNS